MVGLPHPSCTAGEGGGSDWDPIHLQVSSEGLDCFPFIARKPMKTLAARKIRLGIARNNLWLETAMFQTIGGLYVTDG